MRIDSPSNPRVRAIAALRERRERLARSLTLVDGARECLRALDSPARAETAVICPPLVRSEDAGRVVARLEERPVPTLEVGERAWDKVAYGDRNDGVLLVVATGATSLASLEPSILGRDPLIVVTEDVEKPGNLGAIIRTADGAGADAVIAIGGTDLFNPNVVRASVGTIFHVPVAAASAAEAIDWLRRHEIRILTARLDASAVHSTADLTGRLAIVLGSEAEGLGPVWHDAEIEGVRIPMHGVADSLNVSASAAVLLYEARRQRSAMAAQTEGR